MNLWDVVKWVGVCASAYGGLAFVFLIVKARRRGIRHPMQRGFLAVGIGSLFLAAYIALPADQLVLKSLAVLDAAGLMLVGYRVIKPLADAADAQESH